MRYIFAVGATLLVVSIGIPLLIIVIGALWGCLLAPYHLWQAFVEAHHVEN